MRGVCSQGYVREEVLAEQITDVLQKVSLPSLWADNMLAKIESEREHDAQNGVAFAQNLKQEIEDLDKKKAIIIASEENLEDKKNFLKKIGSNHLLDARTLLISAKKSWEILLSAWDFNSPATFTREARVPIFGLYSTMLRG